MFLITKEEKEYIAKQAQDVYITKTKNKYFVEETTKAMDLLNKFRESQLNLKNKKKGRSKDRECK